MNTYENKETGVIIVTESKLSGDWELVENIEKPKKKSKSEKVETEEE